MTPLNNLVTNTDIIQRRFSCRHYHQKAIDPAKIQKLQDFLEALPTGPFGSLPRFKLVVASETDNASLRGLGTYGFIRGAKGFIIGAMPPSEKDLEDFGYLMEAIILHATRLELGTCWLGGTFTKSSFSKEIGLRSNETIPAATSIGEYFDQEQTRKGLVRRVAGADHRLPWDELFFDETFGNPLDFHAAGEYAKVLSMVRIGPSASNKQPWRIVRAGKRWHFYLQRTPGYRTDPIKRILDLCDLQRLDMGIAMCHFELTARELRLAGQWGLDDLPHEGDREYIVSWG